MCVCSDRSESKRGNLKSFLSLSHPPTQRNRTTSRGLALTILSYVLSRCVCHVSFLFGWCAVVVRGCAGLAYGLVGGLCICNGYAGWGWGVQPYGGIGLALASSMGEPYQWEAYQEGVLHPGTGLGKVKGRASAG